MSKPWLYAAGAAALIVVTTLCFRACVDSAARFPGKMIASGGDATAETVRKISGIFSEALQLTPKIVSENRIVLEQSTPLAEFSVLQKEGSYEFTWKHSWMGSGKQIRVRGNYRAKAGFDLSQPFTVTLEKDGSVMADLPPARILSFEKIGPLQIDDDNGWLNRVTSAERSEVINTFEDKARQEMEQSGLLAEAEAQALQRLRDLAARNGQEMTFRFRKLPAP